MQREFKFRVWNGNKMLNVGVLDIDSNKAMDYYNWYDGYFGESVNLDEDSSVLMQYTGLKDKNKKNSFEGDIIQRNHEHNKKLVKGKIVFSNGAFRIKWLDSTNWNDILHIHIEESKIIGNIYENPNLL